MNIPFPKQRYNVIVVDPPWPVKKIQRKSRPNQKQMDYSIMSLEEIAQLPIRSIAADASCWCFMWTIQKFLPDTFSILRGWGFKYQRTLTWDKQNGMCLFGFHHRTEFVVVGYCGKVKMYPKQKAMPTVFTESSWRKHSIKPTCFYKLVERFGDSRIDIFARKHRAGWDAVGFDIDGKDIRQTLENMIE